MSNSIQLLQQSNLPTYLQGKPSDELMRMNQEAAQGTVGKSVNRFSLKQSRFRLIKGGEEINVLKSSEMDVIIILANSALTKTYFEKAYVPGQEAEAPDCYSEDGIRPAADAKKKQHDNCAECPHNQWGSKINPNTGAEGKACADSKRVAVVPPDDVEGEPWQLPIPAASMKDFGSYMTRLSMAKPPIPYNAVVTRVSFDTTADYPKILFQAVRYLTNEEYATIDPRREDPEVKLTAGLPGMGFSPNAQAAAEQAAAVKADDKPAQQAQPAQQEKPAQQEQVASGWGAAAKAAEPQAQAQAKPQQQETVQQPAAQETVAGMDAWGASSEPQETKPVSSPQGKEDPAPAPAVEASGDDIDDLLEGWDLD